MVTLFFVSEISKRWYKAGLVSPMIDVLALSGKCTSGPKKSTIPLVYILVWMLCSNGLQGIWLLGTKCGVDQNNKKKTLFFSVLNCWFICVKSFLIVLCRAAECFCWVPSHSLECTQEARAALNGGFSALKASVAISTSLYFYLAGSLCIITPCQDSRCSKKLQAHCPRVQQIKRNSV